VVQNEEPVPAAPLESARPTTMPPPHTELRADATAYVRAAAPARTSPVAAVLLGAVALAGLGALGATNRDSLAALVEPASSVPGLGAAATAEIVLELDSRPTGAQIARADGARLGSAPLVVRLPRAKAAATLVFTKPGHEPVRTQVTPDRDAIVTVDLRRLGGR
jgi:hypothetical protein